VRAALTPVVSQLGVDVGQLLGGVIVVEEVFGLGGLGFDPSRPSTPTTCR
jgi:peptide/nickel transport system permease protein